MNLSACRTFNGIPVVSSPLAIQTVPVRQHKPKGRGAYLHRTCYCRRIQKKWNKRFGMKTEPAFFVSEAGLIGGKTIFMHPSLLAKLEAGQTINL